jgi:hypothetical protein
MARPDLSSPEGRRAYAAELRGVARGWRWTGLAIVAASVAGMFLLTRRGLPWSSPLGTATAAGLVIGWGLAIVGIFHRSRYHARRMRDRP